MLASSRGGAWTINTMAVTLQRRHTPTVRAWTRSNHIPPSSYLVFSAADAPVPGLSVRVEPHIR